MQNENGSSQENPYSPPCTPIGGLDTKRSGSLLRKLVVSGCTFFGTLCGWGAAVALFGHPALSRIAYLFNMNWWLFMISGGAFGAWIAFSGLSNHQKRD